MQTSYELNKENFYTAYKGLYYELPSLLNLYSKKEIYELLIGLEDPDRLNFLLECLNENTALAKRFWRQEGALPCWIKAGYLKRICNYLEHAILMKTNEANISPFNLFNWYYKLATVFSLQSKADAIIYYHKALLIQSSCLTHQQILRAKNNYMMAVNASTKEDLFKVMEQENDEVQQIQLLTAAMSPKTIIGKRFWKKEGWMPCSMKKGYLNKIFTKYLQLCIENLSDENAFEVHLSHIYNLYYNKNPINNNNLNHLIYFIGYENYQLGNIDTAKAVFTLLLKSPSLADQQMGHKGLAELYRKKSEQYFGFFIDFASLKLAIYHYHRMIELSADSCSYKKNREKLSRFLESKSKEEISLAINTLQFNPIDPFERSNLRI